MSRYRYLLLVLAVTAPGVGSTAQELSPRAYWPAPRGTKLVTFAYQYSSGDVIFDPALPVVGVESRIHLTQISYFQTLDLAGRTANLQMNLPFTWGTTEGTVDEVDRSRTVAGLADARARLSVNLLGAPSMNRSAFGELRKHPRPILGASLQVSAPTGAYDRDRFINVGANRWAIKPELGYIYPVTKTWLTEFDLGVWFYGDNDAFLNAKREQDPIVSGEFHLVKRVRPGFWFSLDLNYYYGGRTTIDNEVRADLQRNSRAGFTLTFPWHKRHAIRASLSTGTVTTSGGDYNLLNLMYAYAWN